jgi:hypothetical protein
MSWRGAGADRVVNARSASDALHEFDGAGPDILILDLTLVDSDKGSGIAEIALQLFHPPPEFIF